MAYNPIHSTHKFLQCHIQGDSIASGLLEYPQYTHPRVWNGREVPEILLSGDHGKIARWRLEQSVALTRERRPDLLEQHPEFEQMLRPKPPKSKKVPHTPPSGDPVPIPEEPAR